MPLTEEHPLRPADLPPGGYSEGHLVSPDDQIPGAMPEEETAPPAVGSKPGVGREISPTGTTEQPPPTPDSSEAPQAPTTPRTTSEATEEHAPEATNQAINVDAIRDPKPVSVQELSALAQGLDQLRQENPENPSPAS